MKKLGEARRASGEAVDDILVEETDDVAAASLAAHPIDELATFFGYAIFAPENADRVVSAFREEIDRALTWGFAAEEVDAVRQAYLHGTRSEWSSHEALASMLNFNLSNDRTMAFAARLETAIENLSADDLLGAMRRHIHPENMSVFRAGDFAAAVGP